MHVMRVPKHLDSNSHLSQLCCGCMRSMPRIACLRRPRRTASHAIWRISNLLRFCKGHGFIVVIISDARPCGILATGNMGLGHLPGKHIPR